MKDFTLRAFRLVLHLLPDTVKKRLHTFRALREWYGDKLRKSSIAYEVPSASQVAKLFKKNLAAQAQEISRMVKHNNSIKEELDFVVVDTGSTENLFFTLNRLEQYSSDINHLYILTNQELEQNQISNAKLIRSQEALKNLEFKCKTFILHAGQAIHEELAQILFFEDWSSDVVYFDSFYSKSDKTPVIPLFKPDWNPDLLLSTSYIDGGLILTNFTNLLRRCPFEVGEDDCSSWLAKSYLKGENFAIEHAPYSLIAQSHDYQPARDCTLKLLKKYKNRISVSNNAEQPINSVMWLSPSTPLVSLIIPTFNGKELVKMCIESILNLTTYPNFEIILVDNNSDDPECLNYFSELNAHPRITLLQYPKPFNYSAINNFAVSYAKGEVVGLINNDIEVITPEWLTYMVGHALREDIGCVGAKLLYPDDRIQHAGVVMGYGGGAGHAHKYFPRFHPGYMNRIAATQNYSAVTAACLLVKKSLYEKVGGLNEKDLEVAFNDVDFCLKVLETDVRNVYCAEAELYHYESVSRGLDISEEKAARFNRELNYLQRKWRKYIDHDPAYNPNLTRKRENFSLKQVSEYNNQI